MHLGSSKRRSRCSEEHGFTMVAAVLVLFVGSLLLAAAFAAANGDITLTRTNLETKRAYYAALAGIASFQHRMNSESNYWQSCPKVTEKVPQTSAEASKEPVTEEYSYQVIPASGSGYTSCSTTSPTTSAVQSGGKAGGTLRLISTGKVKIGTRTESRSVVATFTHTGFTNYVYYTNYEDLDPSFYNATKECTAHYAERVANHVQNGPCLEIEFITGDEIKGPVHTNDAALICGEPKFGRAGRSPKDKIEINGGTYSEGCSDSPKFEGEYLTNGKEITPPPTDTELANSASSEYRFEGKTIVTLKGNLSKPEEANTMTVENAKINGGAATTLTWPVSGVIYVSNSTAGCGYSYLPFKSIYTEDSGCGNVYVKGTYTKPLTIGAANDVIINGNIETSPGGSSTPTGSGTLGLIATNYVRVYHPVKLGYEATNKTPSTEAALNGKCVTEKEVSARIHKLTEVTEVTTTGLEKGYEVEGTGIEAETTISEVKEAEKKIKLSKAAKASAKELAATINRSTEVSGITTSTLKVGDEVEGTVAGQTEGGTVITEIKEAEKKIKLSKAAKTVLLKELTGKIESGSFTVKEITTTGLVSGEAVEGAGIPAETTISEVKESEKKIKLSKEAKETKTTTLKFYSASESTKLKLYGETIKLKVYVPTGDEYNSKLNECHKAESGYDEYREAENVYIDKCESGTTTNGTFCEYENSVNGCSSKATNLNSTEDPNKWGYLENPIIDAAILLTAHSFIVDNYRCGKSMGKLTVWGSIAQNFRGTVGTSGGNTGYLKNYNYDERLAADEPPGFIIPSNVTWSVTRETQPPNACNSSAPSECNK